MAAGKLNFTIEQGTTWLKTLTLADAFQVAIDLTNKTLRGQIRASIASPIVAGSFVFTKVNAAGGVASMSLDDVATADLVAGPSYVYDVEMEDDITGEVVRLLQGKIKISPEVTRE